MFESLKAKMFPCTKKLNRAIAENRAATSRVISACTPKDMYGNCLAKAQFPELKPNQIVNPR